MVRFSEKSEGKMVKENQCYLGYLSKKSNLEIQVPSLGQDDPLEKEMATHCSILAWEIPMDRGAWQATVHGVKKESDMI